MVGGRSPWSPGRRHHRAFGRRRPTLVRISVPDVPLQIGQLLAPFPLNIWEEAQVGASPRPYKVRCLSDSGAIQVEHTVQFSFKIGAYEDTLECDVVPMSV